MRDAIVGFQGLASALAHMHDRGLVDQDLSAGNVLLTLDGSAFVKVSQH